MCQTTILSTSIEDSQDGFFGTFLGALSKSEKKIHIYFILGLSHLEQEERNLFLKVTHLQASYAD